MLEERGRRGRRKVKNLNWTPLGLFVLTGRAPDPSALKKKKKSLKPAENPRLIDRAGRPKLFGVTLLLKHQG